MPTAPTAPAMTFEALPASYGDALLVSCPVPGGTWRMLIDAGPRASWPRVRRRLAQLPTGADRRRHIDLALVTHIDHDHIGAVPRWFDDAALGLAFGDIWFNGRRHLDPQPTCVGEGESLAALLGAAERDLPWNLAFAGQRVCTPRDGGLVALPAPPGYPRLTLLSPTPRRLARLSTGWDAALERLRRGQPDTDAKADTGAALVGGTDLTNLEALARAPVPKDASLPNGSSIAVLLEHGGASLLLGADAYPAVLGSALRTLARQRGLASLQVDAFKLSHHGSRGNLTGDLLGIVQARHYVVSTDNSHFGHPNDETLARVVLHGGAQPVLCFNHATERNLRWADPRLQRDHRFTTLYPADPAAGAVLRLSGPP